MRVKDIAVLPFADTAQKLLVTNTREELKQPRGANWYDGTWSPGLENMGATPWRMLGMPGATTTWVKRLNGVT